MAIERASNQHQKETESLQAALSERDVQASELQTRCDELLSDHVTLTEDLASAHDSIARLEGEKAALAASVRTLAERIQKLEAFKRTLIASLQDDTPGAVAAGMSSGGGGSSLWGEAPKAAPPPEGERLVQEILANAKPAPLPHRPQLLHGDSGMLPDQSSCAVGCQPSLMYNSHDASARHQHMQSHSRVLVADRHAHDGESIHQLYVLVVAMLHDLPVLCCAVSRAVVFQNISIAHAASKQHRMPYKNGTSHNGYTGASANGLRSSSASGRERGVSPATSHAALTNPHPLNSAHIMHDKPPASQLPAAQLHNTHKSDNGPHHHVTNENSMASVNAAADHSGSLPAFGGGDTPVPGEGDGHPQRVDGKEFFRQVLPSRTMLDCAVQGLSSLLSLDPKCYCCCL